MSADKPRLGISACLLGEVVRYDGGHKRDRLLIEAIGPLVEWVPVCPEAGCGLGVPRETMHLVGDPAGPRLLTTRSGVDHTARLLAWSRERLESLAREDLAGFVFKARSPSCGLAGVPVVDDRGEPCGMGAGLFARAYRERFPERPVIDEGRLQEPKNRERFLTEVGAGRSSGGSG